MEYEQAQRENFGGEEAKRNKPLNERGNTACLSLSITITNKQTNTQTKGLGAKNYLTESGPQAIMATTGYRNLSCTGGKSLTSSRNLTIVLGESFLCAHAEEEVLGQLFFNKIQLEKKNLFKNKQNKPEAPVQIMSKQSNSFVII